MANNSLSSIRSAIDSLLDGVSSLDDVQSGKTFEFAGFPAARYYLIGIENNFESTASDYRIYRFHIDIIAPIHHENGTVATMEAAFEDAIDATLDALGNAWTLNGNAEQLKVNPGNVTVEEFPFGPANILSIVVEVQTLIDLS